MSASTDNYDRYHQDLASVDGMMEPPDEPPAMCPATALLPFLVQHEQGDAVAPATA